MIFSLPFWSIALGVGCACLFPLPAATVRTLDGRTLEGAVSLGEQALLITPAGGAAPLRVALTNLDRATLGPGQFYVAGSQLANGWLLTDVGETRGVTRLDGDQFHFRVEGLGTNRTASHFVHRSMPGNGEIVARLERAGGSGAGGVGVLLRSHDRTGAFAALGVENDGLLWFRRRNSEERREVLATAGPEVRLPVWVRLQKRDKFVAAAWSADGEKWQPVGNDLVNLPFEKTWREHEGELQLVRAQIGGYASSYTRDGLQTGMVSQVSLKLNGLLGQYFEDGNFQSLKFARLDPMVRFSWGLASPDPSINDDHFSVRWTGLLIPSRTGEHRFYFDADNDAWLWIDGKAVVQSPLKKSDRYSRPEPVSLVANRPVTVRLDFKEGNGEAAVRLGWGFRDQEPDVIAMTNFSHGFAATNAPERTTAARIEGDLANVRGVLLRDGSFLAGTVNAADVSATRIALAGSKELSILNSRVARIAFRPLRQAVDLNSAQGRVGVFTKAGDFLEGEIQTVQWGAITLNSILFGLKRYSVENGEAVVLVLNDLAPVATTYEVRLLNGSALRARSLVLGGGQVTLEEPLLGGLTFSLADIFEIRRLAARP